MTDFWQHMGEWMVGEREDMPEKESAPVDYSSEGR